MIESKLLKGFRDFGPKEQSTRQAIFAKIQSSFERFGFLPLSTPALEYKEILMGKYGEDEKLIYSFKDNGDRDVALRYDLTVPLARFIAQNQNQLVYPFKRYQIAPVWRADNTQKGRYREFYQCDVDVVGTESQLADAEVVACLCKALEALQVTSYELRVNDRRNFEVFGKNATEIIRSLDKVNKIGVAGVVAELESKGISNADMDLAKKLMAGKMDLPYQNQLEELKQLLIIQGIPEKNIIFDTSIARGLDYYTSMVFEITLTDKPEYGSICSGGRYDNLVDQYSKQSLPAVGGSIGIDRLIDAMAEMGVTAETSVVRALVLNLDEKLTTNYLALINNLRSAGISAELYYETAKLDKQFKYAENKGIAFAVIVGEKEAALGVVQLKNLQTREQKEVKQSELINLLK